MRRYARVWEGQWASRAYGRKCMPTAAALVADRAATAGSGRQLQRRWHRQQAAAASMQQQRAAIAAAAAAAAMTAATISGQSQE